MNCRLPKKIGTPGGGTSYPDGAFIPVKKFTAGKTYALVAKIDGVYRYISSTKFNDYTITATEVSVTPGGGYVTFGSEPALFKAEASGDGFTLANGTNYLYGYSDQYSTALRIDTSSSVWTADTSETGSFESGKYLPKEVSSSVWLKNASGDYEWSIKYESANASFGYDRAGRDSTYSTGFVSFILYEKYEGNGGSGETPSGTVTLTVTHDGTASGTTGGHVEVNGVTIEKGTSIEIDVGTAVSVYSGGYSQANSYITLNGTEVARGSTAWPYTYIIEKNTTISYSYSSGSYGVATITTEGSSGGSANEYAITVTGAGSSSLCYLTINSTTVTSAGTYAVKEGDSIGCTIRSAGTGAIDISQVILNNAIVLKTYTDTATYTFTPTSNATINLYYDTSTSEIYITTE